MYCADAAQKLGIKTSALEEKRTACEMLCIYARQLEGEFAPFVEKVMAWRYCFELSLYCRLYIYIYIYISQ